MLNSEMLVNNSALVLLTWIPRIIRACFLYVYFYKKLSKDKILIVV